VELFVKSPFRQLTVNRISNEECSNVNHHTLVDVNQTPIRHTEFEACCMVTTTRVGRSMPRPTKYHPRRHGPECTAADQTVGVLSCVVCFPRVLDRGERTARAARRPSRILSAIVADESPTVGRLKARRSSAAAAAPAACSVRTVTSATDG
jgi:hypothetical protein